MTNCYKKDFYNCVNKEWIENTIIPSSDISWGTFEILDIELNKKLLNIIINNPILKMIFLQYHNKDSYNSLLLLNKVINILNSITNKTFFFNSMMKLYLLYDFPFFIKLDIEPYIHDSNIFIPYINQPNLIYPLELYSNVSENNNKKKYIEYVNNYSKLFNLDIDGELIYDIEQQLYSKITELDNIDINIISYNKFIDKYPNLIFFNLLYKYTDTIPDKLNLFNKDYLNKLNNLITEKTIEEWKKYFIYKIIEKYNYCFTDKIEKFYTLYKYNLKFNLTLEYNYKYKLDKSLSFINEYLSDIVGNMFSIQYNPSDELINIVNIIISKIKNTLKNSILNNIWMSSNTKDKSIDKLNILTIDIHNTSNINPKLNSLKQSNCFLKNILKSCKIQQKKKIKKILYKKHEYLPDLNIYEINAFYTPLFNKIIIPIGILIEPIISVTQSMSCNFAGIGIILGHEIIHGFDTNGCKYDKNGNYNALLNTSDFIIYNKLVDKFKNQFKNKNINIDLTIDENIADLGGINLSIKGLSNYLDSINVIDKKEEYKNFFIHYAKMWKSKTIKEDLHIILNDNHSPPDIRVNNMLTNIDEFYYAFDIIEGDTLFLKPDDRINIW